MHFNTIFDLTNIFVFLTGDYSVDCSTLSRDEIVKALSQLGKNVPRVGSKLNDHGYCCTRKYRAMWRSDSGFLIDCNVDVDAKTKCPVQVWPCHCNRISHVWSWNPLDLQFASLIESGDQAFRMSAASDRSILISQVVWRRGIPASLPLLMSCASLDYIHCS